MVLGCHCNSLKLRRQSSKSPSLLTDLCQMSSQRQETQVIGLTGLPGLKNGVQDTQEVGHAKGCQTHGCSS